VEAVERSHGVELALGCSGFSLAKEKPEVVDH
jgi:hypothetical protein